MYTKFALKALYPYLDSQCFEPSEPSVFKVANDMPLYGEQLDVVNKLLIRDPETGHADSLVNYILSHTGATAQAAMQFVARIPAATSPNLTDEERLALLVPRNLQEAGELEQVSQALENYLSSYIAESKKAEAAKAEAAKAEAAKASTVESSVTSSGSSSSD